MRTEITRRGLLGLAAGAMMGGRATLGAAPASGFEVGPFRKIYEAGPDPAKAPWHVNDHGFVRGPDGSWHAFGIAWPDPGVKPEPPRGFLEHIAAPSLDAASWTRLAPVMELRADRGETVMWAPHVVEHDGTYHLFVCTGGPDLSRWGITRATSRDLKTWERAGDGPVFRDGFQARDPMVFRVAGENLWALYYTATEEPAGGRHVVAYRTSRDLLSWSDRQIAYRDVHRGTDFGPTESPFVVARSGRYYLFLGPRPYDPPSAERPNYRHPGYDGTDILVSDDWRRWDDSGLAGHVPAHAAEVIDAGDGSWRVSHCGIGRGGLYLARLRWPES